MLITKHTIETTASLESIWNIGKDVKNWNTWDKETEYSSINGPFEKGTNGNWKAKGGPLLQTKLTRVEPLKMFVVEYKLFFARVINSHYLNQSAGKTLYTQHIEIKGPLAFLFAWHLSSSMKKNLPTEMEVMVKKAEDL